MRRFVWLGLLCFLLGGCQGSETTTAPVVQTTATLASFEAIEPLAQSSRPNPTPTEQSQPSQSLVAEQLEITIDLSHCEEAGIDVPLDYRNAILIVDAIIPEQKCNLHYLEDFRIGDSKTALLWLEPLCGHHLLRCFQQHLGW